MATAALAVFPARSAVPLPMELEVSPIAFAVSPIVFAVAFLTAWVDSVATPVMPTREPKPNLFRKLLLRDDGMWLFYSSIAIAKSNCGKDTFLSCTSIRRL